jgi:aspartate/methionine/tyrosine aminotransferase
MGLRARDTLIKRHLMRINRNLGLLDEFFGEFNEDFEWVMPRAGTIGFAHLRKVISAEDFCQKVIQGANIMLLPSRTYDYGDRHFRLGFGRENMPEALEQLVIYLKRSAVNGKL